MKRCVNPRPWSVFHSSGPVGGRYGLMTRNQIHNGGSCHWFDNVRKAHSLPLSLPLYLLAACACSKHVATWIAQLGIPGQGVNI